MAYELRDNSGSMFKNTRKDNDRQADMTGDVMIDGQTYWINGWRKVDKNGNAWYSFSFKKKEARQNAPQQVSRTPVDDDSIPF